MTHYLKFICITLLLGLIFMLGSTQDVFGEANQTYTPPATYYNGTAGLYGDDLKSVLHDIIDNHTSFPYSSSSTDTWDILQETDVDPNNANNVILFYTGWSISGPDEYDGGNGWNREHVWAKSHGGFSTSSAPGTDVHMLRPSDISVNAQRGNKDFDNGGSLYTDPDGATNCRYDGDSWEPRPEVKGDVARIMFYMAVRYEGDVSGEPDLELVDYTPTSGAIHGDLDVLLEWHMQDPVDDYERNRNDIIYQDYQGNRNPFIDHPEFAWFIWGDVTNPVEVEESLSGGDISLSWNHVVGSFSRYDVWHSANYDFVPNDVGSTSIHTVLADDFPSLGASLEHLTTPMLGGNYYVVVGTADSATYPSKMVGAFTYSLEAGTP